VQQEQAEPSRAEEIDVKALFVKTVKSTGVRYPKEKLQEFVGTCAEHNRMEEKNH
jgi:hypothetical protein